MRIYIIECSEEGVSMASFDKKTEETLSEESAQNSSPDKLWSRIEPAVKRHAPHFKNKRLYALTAAVLLIAAVLYCKPFSTDPKITADNVQDSQGTTVAVPESSNMQKNGYDPSTAKKVLYKPHFNFTLNPMLTRLNPGQKFNVQLNITSMTDSLNFNGTSPVVRIWKLGDDDKPIKEVEVPDWTIKMSAGTGSSQDKQQEINTPELDSSMNAKKTADTVVTLDAPLEQGWYNIDMKISLKFDTTVLTSSGNAVMIFVQYPEGQTWIGSFSVNKGIDSLGYNIEVESIEMADDKTIVTFKISNFMVPSGFLTSLISSDGTVIPLLNESQESSGSGCIGTSTFGPVPKSSSSLTFIGKDIVEHTGSGSRINPGPWKIEIPLQ